MKNGLFYISFFLLLVNSSCIDRVSLTPDSPIRILSVEGFISDTDTTHWVKLTYSESAFNNKPFDYFVEAGALVTLYENEKLVDTLSYNPKSQQFETPRKGIVGNTYSIKITTQDGTKYFSENQTLLKPIPLDTVWSRYIEDNSFNFNSISGIVTDEYIVFIELQDPKDETNFYQWKIHVNDQFINHPDKMSLTDDKVFNGNKLNDLAIYDLSDNQFNELMAQSPNGKLMVRIDQLVINREYYEFISEIQRQIVRTGNVFSPATSRIIGNIRKESNSVEYAQGFFYATSITSGTTEVKKR